MRVRAAVFAPSLNSFPDCCTLYSFRAQARAKARASPYLVSGGDNISSIGNLKVFKRTEELLNKIYPRLANYPKSEKFALCQDIKRDFFGLSRNISLGNSVKSKRLEYLQTADGYLQDLKLAIRLSRNRKYISIAFFEEIDLELTEINKMLSGYIKSVNKK